MEKFDDELLAEFIFKKVDVLVDTSGMTRTNKLNIFKLNDLAKTQISWAGWLASTHLNEIDYIVGDKFCSRESR